MKKWMIFFLASMLINCAEGAHKNDIKNIRPVADKATSIDRAIDAVSETCGNLNEEAEFQFLFYSQEKSWFFYIFPKRQSSNSKIKWVKVCAELMFVSLNGSTANGVFYSILSQEEFIEVLMIYEEIDFFELPELISNENIIPSAPRYIIEAKKDGKIHRVELVWQEPDEYYKERDKFLRLWNSFFRLLPLKPPSFNSE